MAERNDRLFYASGALSLGIFFLTTLLFASVLFNYDSVKSFAMSQQDYIAVSLVSLPKRASEQRSAPEKSPVPVKEPETKEELITTPDAPKDVSSLFDSVWTEDISRKKRPVKKPETDIKRLSAIEKRIKSASKSKQTSSAAEKVASLKLAKPSVSVEGSGSAGAQVHEYYAKIQAVIYNHFHPPANSEGNSAKVYLRLDGRGQVLDARVLINSGQPIFDREVEMLLRRLQSAGFPPPKDGKGIELKIILTAEE